MEPRHIADRLGRAQAVKSSARSAIGMAEMLAHEIKNPLAGITGAAQLLSMNLEPGGPGTDRPDRRRKPPHRDAAGTGRTVRQPAPADPPGGEHPRPAGPRPQVGAGRVRRAYEDRRGLRPLAAADLRRRRPDAAGVPEPAQERLRGGARQAGTIRLRTFYDLVAAAAAQGRLGQPAAAADRDHRRRPRHCRPTSPPTSSSPSSRAARTAPGWASRLFRRSSRITTAGSRSIRCPGAPCSACRCPWRRNLPGRLTDGWHRSCRR